MNSNQRLTVTLSVLAALVVTFILAYNIGRGEADLAERVLNECVTNDANDLSSDTVAILRSEGWTSNPNDGAERLYSPAC